VRSWYDCKALEDTVVSTRSHFRRGNTHSEMTIAQPRDGQLEGDKEDRSVAEPLAPEKREGVREVERRAGHNNGVVKMGLEETDQ
jgi:hypothetical protein